MSNDLFFAPEDESSVVTSEPWKILIVDDESSVHDVTKLALHRFTYKDRGLQFTSAYSAKEAQKILQTEHFAVAFVDVIMETDDAGLQLVDHIRKMIEDAMVRIIIRTGQPGLAPERYVIDNYDINDYKEKTELTADRFYTSLRTALAQYDQLEELAQKMIYSISV
jgi:DNA-binding NtrC family response regulator